MGLFGNKEAKQLREVLMQMHRRPLPLGVMDAIRGGDLPPDSGVANFNSKISNASDLVKKLVVNGQRAEAEAVLNEFRQKPALQMAIFSANTPDPGAFAQAAAEAVEQLDTMASSPEQDAQWRAIVDEVQHRAARG